MKRFWGAAVWEVRVSVTVLPVITGRSGETFEEAGKPNGTTSQVQPIESRGSSSCPDRVAAGGGSHPHWHASAGQQQHEMPGRRVLSIPEAEATGGRGLISKARMMKGLHTIQFYSSCKAMSKSEYARRPSRLGICHPLSLPSPHGERVVASCLSRRTMSCTR